MDDCSNTILLAETTPVYNQLHDSSTTGGTALKTHRPTNAIPYEDGYRSTARTTPPTRPTTAGSRRSRMTPR